MREYEVRGRANAKPLRGLAYPIGPYRFYHGEFLVITYSTDTQRLLGGCGGARSFACRIPPGFATTRKASRSFPAVNEL
jgi:hypothetical protein